MEPDDRYYDREEGSSNSAITFADAIEALSNIADMKVDAQSDVQGAFPEISAGRQPHRAVQLFENEDSRSTIQVAKNSFRVILKYLQKFYHKESGYMIDPRTVEGIKNIMMLVGEAAKKLDRYSQILHGVHAASVTDLKEYRQLQEFYQRRIARKIDERVLSGWILQLAQPQPQDLEKFPEAVVKTRAKKRVFIDLEGVHKDLDYELFFLRKEDGSRYYNPRLVRNLRLVCDFGDYIGDIKKDDPLSAVDMWQDRVFHATASSILKSARHAIDTYLQEAARYKEKELVEWLNKALTALFLSANPRNLMSQQSLKSCTEYFFDCQQFLRGALNCREYQKLVVYPPKKEHRVACALRDVVHALCKAMYSQVRSYPLIAPVIAETIDRAVGIGAEIADLPWWERLNADYIEMTKHLKYHPNRPLRDVLTLLDEGGRDEWDPLLQRNLPARLFDMSLEDMRVSDIRMACPVRQEYINKAIVNEEFKEWLRAEWDDTAERQDTHLLINLQDSTSWEEHARCKVIEELPRHAPYDKRLTTMTLATDTDFYHQRAPYHRVGQADLFIQQFKEHLAGEGSGFYFPQVVEKALNAQFTDQLFGAIHEIFFSARNALSPKERMNFIEIVYLFLVLKALDVVGPDSFSLVCKDGVDIGSAFNALLFGSLKVMNQDSESSGDREAMELILYAAPLLVRERAMAAVRFQRMLDALRCVIGARAEHGAERLRQQLREKLGALYQRPWWQAVVSVPKGDAIDWR